MTDQIHAEYTDHNLTLILVIQSEQATRMHTRESLSL